MTNTDLSLVYHGLKKGFKQKKLTTKLKHENDQDLTNDYYQKKFNALEQEQMEIEHQKEQQKDMLRRKLKNEENSMARRRKAILKYKRKLLIFKEHEKEHLEKETIFAKRQQIFLKAEQEFTKHRAVITNERQILKEEEASIMLGMQALNENTNIPSTDSESISEQSDIKVKVVNADKRINRRSRRLQKRRSRSSDAINRRSTYISSVYSTDSSSYKINTDSRKKKKFQQKKPTVRNRSGKLYVHLVKIKNRKENKKKNYNVVLKCGKNSFRYRPKFEESFIFDIKDYTTEKLTLKLMDAKTNETIARVILPIKDLKGNKTIKMSESVDAGFKFEFE